MVVLWDASHSMIECRRHRLQPHPNQEAELNRQLGVLRRLWNRALEERQTTWQARRESVTLRQQCKSLTTWRKEDPEGLGQINAQAAQAQLRRLDDAFKRFFKGITKYPRFKAFGEQVSLTFPQATGTEIGKRSGKIRLSCIGYVPIIQHRDEPEGGKLKTITVKQDAGQQTLRVGSRAGHDADLFGVWCNTPRQTHSPRPNPCLPLRQNHGPRP